MDSFFQAKLESKFNYLQYKILLLLFCPKQKKLAYLKLKKHYNIDASYVKVGIPEKLQIPKIDFFEADFYYQRDKNKKKFLENTNGETNKPLFVWQDKTQPVPNPKNYSAILFDFL